MSDQGDNDYVDQDDFSIEEDDFSVKKMKMIQITFIQNQTRAVTVIQLFRKFIVFESKYGTYSLMDKSSEKIVDFSLVHVGEVSSSNAVENEGCQTSLNVVLNKKVKNPIPYRGSPYTNNI